MSDNCSNCGKPLGGTGPLCYSCAQDCPLCVYALENDVDVWADVLARVAIVEDEPMPWDEIAAEYERLYDLDVDPVEVETHFQEHVAFSLSVELE